jgi:4-hydroxythreonine-4-phosphate dehydrogenase
MAAGPRLLVVAGEPAGIGPELCVRLAQRHYDGELLVLADPDCLMAYAKQLHLPLNCLAPGEPRGIGELNVLPFTLSRPVTPGQLEPVNSARVIDALKFAANACQTGEFDAMVTGPVHKAGVNAAGIAYTGTTELLARLAGAEVLMMLANAHMRVALATTHLPLRAVADAINPETLERSLRILQQALNTQFGIRHPRIAVLGLNPHAGEQGVLGLEELEIIIPVLNKLRAEGFTLLGPLPADTAFLPSLLAQVDAVLAMYHDQGLPVLKYAGFEQAVNITLGLPYPRVAVDHGTALDLAGKGSASDESLWQAVQLASRLAQARRSA